MKLIPRAFVPAALLAAACLAPAVHAQDVVDAPPPGGAARSVSAAEAVGLPDAKISGDVRYVSGGIPFEQLPAFESARKQYPLNIEVYERQGTRNVFTAGAEVRVIRVKGGELLLETVTEGPYLWVKLPPGQYRVETTLNDKTRSNNVTVNAGRTARAVVVFPAGTD